MAGKDIRLLIVTNSVPLPATDFLKYKVLGLSKVFDVHLLCWDSKKNKQAFLQKYSGGLKEENLHLGYKVGSVNDVLNTFFHCLLLFIQHPAKMMNLFRNVSARNNGLKRIIQQFLLYAPIVKVDPDIVHFEFGTLAHSFQDLKDYFNCKASTSFRGYDMNCIGLNDTTYYTKVWQTFDGYHFLGNDLKQRAKKRGYKEGKIEALIPPGIDTSLFNAGKEPGYKPDEKLTIVSTGRLIWKKGYEYGIRAAAILKQRNIPFEYRIIGDGEYYEALEFTIHELGLNKEVLLLGAKDTAAIRDELSKADVFLHPAITEGFCNAVLEAQAMGVPAVVSDAGGLAENIADGETGFVVPKWNADALAEKLQWCWENKEEANRMGQHGVARVKATFSLDKQLDRFAVFYRQIYNNGSAVK